MTTEADKTPPPGTTGTNALILAGGGLKVAFQAGVLQVLLNETKHELEFPIADGTSGGTFNLAMYCQGMDGQQIADKWRKFSPFTGISPNWSGLLRGPLAPSVFTFDRYRDPIFNKKWKLKWDRIKTTDKIASFNVYNFSKNILEPKTAAQMNEDLLVACNSLPFWFPPVRSANTGDDTYLDAVYVADANLDQAIKAGADELFVIWTVSRRGAWRDGFVAQYFQTIEEAGNGTFKRDCARIEANNDAIKAGGCGEFGRPIKLRILYGEVPLHYIMNFRRDRVAAAVELGVQAARKWCVDEQGIELKSPPDPPADPVAPGMRFSETMRGRFALGEPDPEQGGEGPYDLRLDLTVKVRDIDRFVTQPEHSAYVSGSVVSEALGWDFPLVFGELNLLTFVDDPGNARMDYRLWMKDTDGDPLTLFGTKYVRHDQQRDMWDDATTLYFRLFAGHLRKEPEDTTGVIGAGKVHISFLGLLRQVSSMRAATMNPVKATQVLFRFNAYFLGRLFDVYGQKILPWSPF